MSAAAAGATAVAIIAMEEEERRRCEDEGEEYYGDWSAMDFSVIRGWEVLLAVAVGLAIGAAPIVYFMVFA